MNVPSDVGWANLRLLEGSKDHDRLWKSNSPALSPELCRHVTWPAKCRQSRSKIFQVPTCQNIIETSISLHSMSGWVFQELSHNSHVQRVLAKLRPHAEPSTFHHWELLAAPLKKSVIHIGIRDVGTDVAKHGAYIFDHVRTFKFCIIWIWCLDSRSFPHCFRWLPSWATDGRAVLWLVFDAQRLSSGWSTCPQVEMPKTSQGFTCPLKKKTDQNDPK